MAAPETPPLTLALLSRVSPSPDVSPRALGGLVSTRHEPPSVPHAWGFCFGNRGASRPKMSEITKDTHATLHQMVAGEDTIKEEGRLGDLVLRYISLSSSQRPEYFIMIGQVEYLPKQIERWARDFGLI
jgi:hypothetical protein